METRKPMRLLDLFCKAGGASMGYHLAGFEVVGIDIKKQKRYPFEFIQANALEVLQDIDYLKTFDVLAGSPPCQTHSITQHLRNAQGKSTDKIDLIPQTREGFIKSGKPYVIENVPGAPLIDPVVMCGSSFGLKVRRHRLFESNLQLTSSICDHKSQGKPVGIYGSMRDEIPNGGHTAKSIEQAREAMGIDWMIWGELVEAIPPVYTQTIGNEIIKQIRRKDERARTV
jgi:DNA (cytosine-5)-methyltransferase 1